MKTVSCNPKTSIRRLLYVKPREAKLRMNRLMRLVPKVLLVLVVVALFAIPAEGQSRRQKPVPAPKTAQPALSDQATEARTNLIAATKSYKQSLETVLELQRKNEVYC